MSLDARAFRDALGAFATGVCVVSAQTENGPIGVTINSFASVSLDPPLVLWSLDRGSDTFEVFTKAKGFTISVMPDSLQALTLRLSRKGDHALGPDSIAVETAEHGAQIRGALSWFVCEAFTTADGGDHVIFIARVTDFGIDPHTKPLLYYRGRFRALEEAEAPA